MKDEISLEKGGAVAVAGAVAAVVVAVAVVMAVVVVVAVKLRKATSGNEGEIS